MNHDALEHECTSNDLHTTVFSLPELRANIVPFLKPEDLQIMLQTCTTWHDWWAPELYVLLNLSQYTRDSIPNVVKYGRHVQTLRLFKTQAQSILFVLQQTPNLRRLVLSYASLSCTELDQILSALPAQVHHLIVTVQSLVRHRVGQASWFPEPMFHSVARLHNLQSLDWDASGMTIHVDDILHVLQACPHLVSLEFSNLKVVYMDSGSSVEHETCIMSGRPSDLPGPLVSAILDTDIAALYVGRRLQKLAFHFVHISDEGVLRLLGIDLVPKAEADTDTGLRPHALVCLDVDHCYSFTHKSGVRILQECDRIQQLNFFQSKIATIDLFQGGLWACSKSIQQLSLDIGLSSPDPTHIHRSDAMLRDGVLPLALADQLLIRDQIQALANLRLFKLKGYPVDLVVLEDMSFARGLHTAQVQLMARLTPERFEQERDRLEKQAKAWVDKQPEGWHVTVEKGTLSYPPKFLIRFLAEGKKVASGSSSHI
ncbi:hypothetical protein CPC16_011366 [Podila verticillata]|nr:hypothetical protein CPC16_011366 [Podila verticillata]